MELKKAIIILLDISGYTRFIRLHKMSLIHAEKIISELFEAVIQTAAPPVVLNKLQGDAVLFYAPVQEEQSASAEILRQVRAFFIAFISKERELISVCNYCVCEACAQVKELKLKAIVHIGDIVIKKILQFEEIAGESVILAHRLLKNSVEEEEYILMSEPFYNISGGLQDMKSEERIEQIEEFGPLMVKVFYPDRKVITTAKPSVWARLKLYMNLEAYMIQRLLGLKKGRTSS